MPLERDTRSRLLMFAASVGAVWGLAGYAVLWGYTSIVIHRPFVISAVGTIMFLPVRIVLWTLAAIERARGAAFSFSENNWWIGVLAAVIGAVIATAILWALRALVRGIRTGRSGRQQIA